MYERIQYSTEEIREVIQTLRRIYDNAEKNLKEWTQIKALLQSVVFQKKIKKTSTSQETEEKVFTLIKLQKTGYYYQRKPRHTGNNTFEARFIWR